MQVADLANVFSTETMEAGTVLFEQGGTDAVSYTHLTLPTIYSV